MNYIVTQGRMGPGCVIVMQLSNHYHNVEHITRDHVHLDLARADTCMRSPAFSKQKLKITVARMCCDAVSEILSKT